MNKTVHVLQISGDPVGGTRKHVHSILLGLREEFNFSYAYSNVNQDAVFESELPEVRKSLINMLPLKIQKRPGFQDINNLIRIIKLVQTNEVHLIHGHGAKGGLYARLAGVLCRKPVIYTPHGGTIHNMFSVYANAIYGLVERFLIRATSFYLFESNYTANGFIAKVKAIPRNYKVNYNGISSPSKEGLNIDLITELRKDSTVQHIGVFGMLRRQKGQLTAIKAVLKLLDKGYPIKLHIFGDGPDFEDLSEFVKKHDIMTSVHFHGDTPLVNEAILAMDFVLIPSVFESFGYVAVEAMSLKKMVIATSTGGLKEIVVHGETGILVEPESPEAIADAVISLVNEPNLKLQYEYNGYLRYLSLFTEDKMLEGIKEVYYSLKSK